MERRVNCSVGYSGYKIADVPWRRRECVGRNGCQEVQKQGAAINH